VLAELPGSTTLIGRIAGRLYNLKQLGNGNGYFYHDGIISVRISSEGQITSDLAAFPSTTHQLDVGRFHALATLLRGITDGTRVHAINTPRLAATEAR
jgi:hypothetical protein